MYIKCYTEETSAINVILVGVDLSLIYNPLVLCYPEKLHHISYPPTPLNLFTDVV